MTPPLPTPAACAYQVLVGLAARPRQPPELGPYDWGNIHTLWHSVKTAVERDAG